MEPTRLLPTAPLRKSERERDGALMNGDSLLVFWVARVFRSTIYIHTHCIRFCSRFCFAYIPILFFSGFCALDCCSRGGGLFAGSFFLRASKYLCTDGKWWLIVRRARFFANLIGRLRFYVSPAAARQPMHSSVLWHARWFDDNLPEVYYPLVRLYCIKSNSIYIYNVMLWKSKLSTSDVYIYMQRMGVFDQGVYYYLHTGKINHLSQAKFLMTVKLNEMKVVTRLHQWWQAQERKRAET